MKDAPTKTDRNEDVMVRTNDVGTNAQQCNVSNLFNKVLVNQARKYKY